MKQGWFIPITLLCFGLSLAGLWAYLTLADTSVEPLVSARGFGMNGTPGGHGLSARRSPESDAELRASPALEAPRILVNSARRIAVPTESPPNPTRSAPPHPSLLETLQGGLTMSKETVARFADRLDEEAVSLRSNVNDLALIEVCEGWRRIGLRQFSRAVEEFDRVLVRDPAHRGALCGKAAALTGLRRFEQAVEVYRLLSAAYPGDAYAHYNRGVALARLGRLGDAAVEFREATRADSRHARAWFNLASLAQRDGRLAEAREAWEAFTKIEPDLAAGWFNLGIVHMEYQQPSEAARCFSYAIIIQPGDVDAYVNLARAFQSSGEFDAALGVLRQADGLSPCDGVVMQALADVHRALAGLHPSEERIHLAEASRLEDELRPLDEDSPQREVAIGARESD